MQAAAVGDDDAAVAGQRGGVADHDAAGHRNQRVADDAPAVDGHLTGAVGRERTGQRAAAHVQLPADADRAALTHPQQPEAVQPDRQGRGAELCVHIARTADRQRAGPGIADHRRPWHAAPGHIVDDGGIRPNGERSAVGLADADRPGDDEARAATRHRHRAGGPRRRAIADDQLIAGAGVAGERHRAVVVDVERGIADFGGAGVIERQQAAVTDLRVAAGQIEGRPARSGQADRAAVADVDRRSLRQRRVADNPQPRRCHLPAKDVQRATGSRGAGIIPHPGAAQEDVASRHRQTAAAVDFGDAVAVVADHQVAGLHREQRFRRAVARHLERAVGIHRAGVIPAQYGTGVRRAGAAVGDDHRAAIADVHLAGAVQADDQRAATGVQQRADAVHVDLAGSALVARPAFADHHDEVVVGRRDGTELHRAAALDVELAAAVQAHHQRRDGNRVCGVDRAGADEDAVRPRRAGGVDVPHRPVAHRRLAHGGLGHAENGIRRVGQRRALVHRQLAIAAAGNRRHERAVHAGIAAADEHRARIGGAGIAARVRPLRVRTADRERTLPFQGRGEGFAADLGIGVGDGGTGVYLQAGRVLLADLRCSECGERAAADGALTLDFEALVPDTRSKGG